MRTAPSFSAGSDSGIPSLFEPVFEPVPSPLNIARFYRTAYTRGTNFPGRPMLVFVFNLAEIQTEAFARRSGRRRGCDLGQRLYRFQRFSFFHALGFLRCCLGALGRFHGVLRMDVCVRFALTLPTSVPAFEHSTARHKPLPGSMPGILHHAAFTQLSRCKIDGAARRSRSPALNFSTRS